MSELLEVNHVSYAYHSIDGETETLADISFHIKEGEFAAIVGPSGCGKSTLLSLICGLLKPEKGEILLDGKSIAGEKERIGYMLQKDYLFEWRSIYSNVMLGLEIQKKKSEKYTKRVDQMLKDYGLWDFRDVRPSQLSGGMRQRAALIRTLALQPELLLLDEPFSALDYQTRLSVCEDIYRIIKKEQKTAVLVTHDLSEAISMADRIFVLSKRPAEIKKEIKLDFNMKERTPMQVRNAPQFRDYFNLKPSESQKNYIRTVKRRRRTVQFMRLFLFLFFVVLWEVAAEFSWIDSFIFSSPLRIAKTAWQMLQDGSLTMHIGVTLSETLISFALVVICGILLAILLWMLPMVSEILEPALVVLNSLPKSALAPLLIVWLGANIKTIILAGMSVAIFGTILNLYTCFSQSSPEKEKLIYTLGGTKKDTLLKVVLPGTVPNILSIMKVNIGLCLVGVVIGEFIGARRGLGYLIIYGSQVFKLDWVLMSIVILCVIAMLLYALLGRLEAACLKRL